MKSECIDKNRNTYKSIQSPQHIKIRKLFVQVVLTDIVQYRVGLEILALSSILRFIIHL